MGTNPGNRGTYNDRNNGNSYAESLPPGTRIKHKRTGQILIRAGGGWCDVNTGELVKMCDVCPADMSAVTFASRFRIESSSKPLVLLDEAAA